MAHKLLTPVGNHIHQETMGAEDVIHDSGRVGQLDTAGPNLDNGQSKRDSNEEMFLVLMNSTCLTWKFFSIKCNWNMNLQSI